MFKSLLKVSAFVSLMFASQANATIIGFEDIPETFNAQYLPSYTESDFILDVSCYYCMNVFSTSEVLNHSGYGTQPAAAAGWGATGRFLETWNTYSVFTLSQVNGEAFDFTAMNIGWFNDSTTNASWNVRVFDENGAQVGSSDNYTGTGLFSFNYESIYSVELQSNVVGASSFDNLNVSVVEASAPATLGLLSLSLVGLGVAGRRKK
ncbi:MAG: hypothetical protein VYD53_07265 [Pseudomonadota bacterium]|nr:hypothetical protein [Pseudomonadota bacterium]